MRWRVVGAGTLARVPSEGLGLAIVLAVAQRGGSAAFAGLLLALTTLPQMVTGPVGGGLLDRSQRPGVVLAVAASATALAGAGLALTDARGGVAVAAALVVACTDPLLTGGLSATFTRWADAVGRTHELSAWDGVAYNVAGVAGPLLVTVLAVTAGADAALVALAAIVAPTVVFVLTGPSVATAPPDDGPRVTAALRAMWRDRPLRGVTVASTLEMAALGGLAIAMVSAAGHHGRAAEAAGTVLTVRAVAALLGSLVLTRAGHAVTPVHLVLVPIALSGTGLVAMGLVPWWTLVVIVGAAIGFADGPVLVGTYRARADGSPAALRASVFTVAASLKLGASSAGALVAGTAIGERDTPAGLVAIGAVCIAASAAGALAARQSS